MLQYVLFSCQQCRSCRALLAALQRPYRAFETHRAIVIHTHKMKTTSASRWFKQDTFNWQNCLRAWTLGYMKLLMYHFTPFSTNTRKHLSLSSKLARGNQSSIISEHSRGNLIWCTVKIHTYFFHCRHVIWSPRKGSYDAVWFQLSKPVWVLYHCLLYRWQHRSSTFGVWVPHV